MNGGSLRGDATNLRGNIVNNAELVFDIPNAQTFSGSVSGTGVIKKKGSGTLSMNGSFAAANSLQILGGAIFASPSTLPQNVSIDVPGVACYCLDISGTGTFNGTITNTPSSDPDQYRDAFSVSAGTVTITQALQTDAGVFGTATLNVTGSVRNVNVHGGTLTGTGSVDSIHLQPGSQLSGSLTFNSLSNNSIEHTIPLGPNNTIPYNYTQGNNGALNLTLPATGMLQGQSSFKLNGGHVTLQGAVPADVAGGAHWPILTADSVFANSSVFVEVTGGSRPAYELVGREFNGQHTLFLRETPIDFLEGDGNGDGNLDGLDAPFMAFALFNPDDILEVPTGNGGTRVYFDFREKLDLVDPVEGVIDFDDLRVFSDLLEDAMGSASAADAAIAAAIASVRNGSQVPEPSTGALLLLCLLGVSTLRLGVR